jgi:hypothetical protein
MSRVLALLPSGRRLLVVLAIALAAAATGIAGAADPGGPVEGQLQQAFVPARASSGAVANTPVADDDPLVVQAVDVGRRSAEPTVAVDTDGVAYYTAANFDSSIGNQARTELMRSTDGGLTWKSVQTTSPVLKSEPATTLDPYVWVDTDTDRVFNVDLVGCGFLQVSDDKGESWESSLAACGDSVDHQTLFGGPRPTGMLLPQLGDYPNVVYYCTNRILDSRCGRSTDGGRTWVTTATPAYPGFDPAGGGMCNGLHGHGVVDKDGRVFLPKGHCGNPWVSISEDGGDTWTRVKVSDKLSGTPVVPVLRYAGTYAHTSMAADDAGNLYYVWPDDKMRPWLSISTDHGRTWQEPLLVAAPGVNETNFPTVDAGAEGTVAIIYVGSAGNTPGAVGGGNARRPWNHYVLTSTNALDAEPLFRSTTTNDPADPIHRGDCFSRCGGMLDFLDVVVAPSGEVWATAVDTCATSACIGGGAVDADRVGRGLAVRQIGGPLLRTPPQAAGAGA